MIAGSAELAQRTWGLRALLVLQSPRTVFAALRNDSKEVAYARQEAVTALVFLAGIGAILLAPATGRLLDDPAVDGLLVLVLTVLQGLIYGFFGYWGCGGLLLAGTRAARLGGSFRQARHLLAFAAAPLALSLVALWPVRLAVYGGDEFRTGGGDDSLGGEIFIWLDLGFLAWSACLLVLGVRVVHGTGWPRALLASSPPLAVPAVAIASLVFR